MRLSEEFIEDEIDNSKDKNYLEKIAMHVVDNHLEEIILLSQGAVAANLQFWFKESKNEIDSVKKDPL